LYTWPSYSTEAHIGLAELYIQDSSFTAYYERYVTGGAQFLRDAIVTNLSDN
ncbi:TipAS antibiotic-recognition domain-containing protein, partial [Staphylococcus arlettae]